MSKLTLKSKTLIAIVLFVAIFGVIIGVASVFDLQISNFMTKDALAPGEYYAHDFFGVFGEIVGTSPIYIVIALCLIVLFLYFSKIWKLRPLKDIISVVCLIGVFAVMFIMFHDIGKYCLYHFGDFSADEHNAAILAIEATFALFTTVFIVLTTKNMKEETVRKLAKFALVAIVGLIVANIVVILVKSPVGRMRYRAMNVLGTFDGYTPWYIANGKPTAAEILPFAAFEGSDAFKSFPSGHTCAAGALYMLMMIPDVINFKKKGTKFAFYIVPFVVTGLVACSRIMVGAHFMSDVAMGGTISFVSMLLVREVFICKFSHLKALFGKKNKVEIKAENVVA